MVANRMMESGGGSIVNTASIAGLRAAKLQGIYSVTKAGLIMLTRQMAQEWAADGIRANCISPGMVLTPMTEANYQDPDFRARREAMCPIPRIADPEADIAGLVLVLLGPDARYMTGQNLLADPPSSGPPECGVQGLFSSGSPDTLDGFRTGQKA